MNGFKVGLNYLPEVHPFHLLTLEDQSVLTLNALNLLHSSR